VEKVEKAAGQDVVGETDKGGKKATRKTAAKTAMDDDYGFEDDESYASDD
jgi:hypothetical protein